MTVKGEINEWKEGVSGPEIRGASQPRIKETNADLGIAEIPFPYVFSKGFLLETDFKSRKMAVEQFKLKVMGIDKAVIEFCLYHHVGSEEGVLLGKRGQRMENRGQNKENCKQIKSDASLFVCSFIQ
jgi:hypothetical protein